MNTLIERISQLKKEKNAVIFAHYYVPNEVQAVADFVGDSYFLSKKATEIPHKTILFCGVSFMGESTKILNPEKTVLMPDITADCPMAHMVSVVKIQQVRQQYKDLALVCYINSTAEIKAHSDVCVTSSNAIQVVSALSQKNIFFIPDQNLANYIAKQIPDKYFIYNDGYCPIHHAITKKNVLACKAKHPLAKILVHPESPPSVVSLADYTGSTSGIINFATKDDATEFIICTEEGVSYELQKRNPTKSFFFPQKNQICKDMKLITLEKIVSVLETEKTTMELEQTITDKAKHSLIRMHEIAK